MRVLVDDIHLNYELSGSGTPVVLTHGLGSNLHYWDDAAQALSAHHQVLRWDVRGFGESDRPGGPYTPRILARDLASLLGALDLPPAHLVGISMGGVINQRLALDYRDRARSLALISTSSEVGPQATANWQRLADRVERDGFDSRSADASRSFSSTFAARHPEVIARMDAETLRNDPIAYAAAARAMSDYHWTAELRAVDIPVLILQGLDDRLTPPGGAVKMNRALPRSRLVMVPGAGHNLPLEQPMALHMTLLAFFAGVELTNCASQPGLVQN
jgi:3-oxoadipate enol-lactonase